MSPETTLRSGLEALDLRVEKDRQDALLSFVDLLRRWNRTYNLTALRSVDEMVSKHILDSLSVLEWIPPGRLLDAGSGAGLPGIPLAIAEPEIDVTTLDSAGKKVRFMNHAKRSLGLGNVHPVQARLESFEPEARPGTVISRAFTSLGAFVAAARHLAGEETDLLAMKGRYPGEEIEALPEWATVRSVEKLDVPGLHEERHLVIMSVCP